MVKKQSLEEHSLNLISESPLPCIPTRETKVRSVETEECFEDTEKQLEMEIVEKQCVKCETKRCIDKFRQYPNNSYSTTCKKCLNEMDKLRKKNQLCYCA